MSDKAPHPPQYLIFFTLSVSRLPDWGGGESPPLFYFLISYFCFRGEPICFHKASPLVVASLPFMGTFYLPAHLSVISLNTARHLRLSTTKLPPVVFLKPMSFSQGFDFEFEREGKKNHLKNETSDGVLLSRLLFVFISPETGHGAGEPHSHAGRSAHW